MKNITNNVISTIALIIISIIVYNILNYQYDKVYNNYEYRSVGSQYDELDCLTENVYFEATNEPLAGMIGVAQVTMNRVKSPRYPNDVCKVVHQKHQFSWTMDKPKALVKVNKRAWDDARIVAKKVLFEGEKIPCVNNALFYHTTGVNPIWNRNMKQTCILGHHKFFEG